MAFTFEQIKELHEMGFSAEQITTFAGTAPDEEKEPEKEQEQEKEQETEPDKEPDKEPEKKQEENPRMDALEKSVSGISAQLTNLVKQMQSNNLRTASVNILPDEQLQKDTDSAMAELIRPSYKKKED